MAESTQQLDLIAQQSVEQYGRQRREEDQWNEPPPEMADILLAMSQKHGVDLPALTQRVRALLWSSKEGATKEAPVSVDTSTRT